MGNPVEGGELIHLVEVDQDLCKLSYGQGACYARFTAQTTNLLLDTDNLLGDAWTQNIDILPDRGESPSGALLDKMVSNASSGVHEVEQSFELTPSQTYTGSCVVEYLPGIVEGCEFEFCGQSALYDLTAGTVDDDSTAGNTATITSLGGDQYRLTITATPGASPQTIRLGLANDLFGSIDPTFTGNGVDGIYAGEFQAETGSAFTSYSPVGSENIATGVEKCYNTLPTCQASKAFNPGDPLTIACVNPVSNPPVDGVYFPSVERVRHTASRLNTSSRKRSEPLGQRASVRVSLTDHPDSGLLVDPYLAERESGAARLDGQPVNHLDRANFWANWRARNIYYLGRSMRTKTGVIAEGQFQNLTTRNFILERVDGPDANGKVALVGKDPLKLLDKDRAQAPRASKGELQADLGDDAGADTTATLSPSGIGASEYPSSGKATIGDELVSFTRSGDTLTLVRGLNGKVDSHSDGDVVQLCVEYAAQSVELIVYDLIVNYTDLDPAFLPLADWSAEASVYIPNAYGGIVCEPTAVKDLIGELAEQAGFSLWWDEVDQLVKFSAVKQPGAGALTIDDDWIIEGSFRAKDLPDSRISEVWTNYGVINPVEASDKANNYALTLVTADPSAANATQYGQEAVRNISSRWIPADGGKVTAQNLNNRLLSRFRDIIREFEFDLPSYRADQIRMGQSHTLLTQYVTGADGLKKATDVRILSVEPEGDRINVTAEELRFQFNPEDLTRALIIDTDQNNVNLRELYETVYASAPNGDEIIEVQVENNVTVGSNSPATPGMDVGDWPVGQDITIDNWGVITGAGGTGGSAGANRDGGPGGTALYSRTPVTVNNLSSAGIYGGGGGGGGLYTSSGFSTRVNGGGGGAGVVGGEGGQGTTNGFPDDVYSGADGTATQGGAGSGVAGAGGGLGQPGQDAPTEFGGSAGLGGAAGNAIDGAGNVTLNNSGTVLGPTS